MIPRVQNEIFEQPRRVIRPSFTYRRTIVKGLEAHLDTTMIQGDIDGIDALIQSLFDRLITPRSRYTGYTSNYGTDLEQFKREGFLYLRSVLPDEIYNSFMQDDRVQDVRLRRIQQVGVDGAVAIFTVFSVLGIINEFALEVGFGTDER